MTSIPLPAGQWVPGPDIPGIPEPLRREGAYLPHPLPGHLVLPTATYRRAGQVEHTLGRLDEAADRLGVRAGLVRSTQVRDAQSSASLAGVMVGLQHALAEDVVTAHDQRLPRPHQPPATASITPYLRAYDHGLARLRAGAQLDVTVVGEMSAIMTGRSGDPTGELVRTGPGWLGSSPTRAYLLTAPGAHLVGLLEQSSSDQRERDVLAARAQLREHGASSDGRITISATDMHDITVRITPGTLRLLSERQFVAARGRRSRHCWPTAGRRCAS